MLKSLYYRLSIVLVLIFFVLGILLIVVINRSVSALQAETTQKLHLDLADNIVKDMRLTDDNGIQIDNIKEAFHMMMVLGPSIELYILNNRGEVVAYDAPEEKIKLKKISMQPISRFLKEGETLPILGDDPRSETKQKIFSAAPLNNVEGKNGYLYIIIGGEQYDRISSVLATNHILRISGISLFIALIFLLSVALVLFYSMTRPIRLLAKEVQDFQDSSFKKLPDFSKKDSHDDDEIGVLQASFENMSSRIAQQLEKLESADQHRREFFAHISHDLRTPLAGLQGYVETLFLKRNDLSEEQKNRFLKSAIKQTYQLGNLINDLFALASAEDHSATLEKDDFMLSELISDILQKAKILADKKEINITFESCNAEPEVHADIGKIERVITNLVSNAIKYTNTNGEIAITLRRPQDRTLLSDNEDDVVFEIKDNGKGIPQSDLSSIFDPYFRASNNDRKERTGGLGLAISQTLLKAHGSTLQIESTENIGTTIRFSLTSKSL